MGKKKFVDIPTGKWYTAEGWPPKSLLTLENVVTSPRRPPQKFVQNFDAKTNQFSKLDNKYKLQGSGEFLGSKELGLKKLSSGAVLHKSDNIISWDSPVTEGYVSRTHGTYTAPPSTSYHDNTHYYDNYSYHDNASYRDNANYRDNTSYRDSNSCQRRFKRRPVPATREYRLSTTTSCWDPDPKHQTLYKVLAETQHRHSKPNTWQYSTHPAYKLADLNM